MALHITPDETPTDQPGQDTGYGLLPVGQTKEDCKEQAESRGGLAWDEHAQACWLIFGREVKIEDLQYSIMEGFEIVNFNFHASSSQPAVPTQGDLPGPNSLSNDNIHLAAAQSIVPNDQIKAAQEASNPNTPSSDQKGALSGTSGTPSAANPYVTSSDSRLPTQDENNALAGTSGAPSASNPYVTQSDGRLLTTQQDQALAGTSGTPSATNKFVTNADTRLTNARTPTQHGQSVHYGQIGTEAQVIFNPATGHDHDGTSSALVSAIAADCQTQGEIGMLHIATPTILPPVGRTKLYCKTDGKLYLITATGTEYPVGVGGSGGTGNGYFPGGWL